MRISARSDYALRALAQLAAHSPDGSVCLKAEEIANAQDIPLKFLLEILRVLRTDHLVRSQRGAEGGYALARPATEISLADVLRALEGPLVTVHDASLSGLTYPGPAAALVDVWMATRAALRQVFDQVTMEQLATGELPAHVRRLAADYAASVGSH